MLLEAGSGLWLARLRPPGVTPAVLWTSVALLVVVWGATLFVSVPKHNVLAAGYDPGTQAALVTTNWIRTIAWTARALLALSMVEAAGRRRSRRPAPGLSGPRTPPPRHGRPSPPAAGG